MNKINSLEASSEVSCKRHDIFPGSSIKRYMPHYGLGRHSITWVFFCVILVLSLLRGHAHAQENTPLFLGTKPTNNFTPINSSYTHRQYRRYNPLVPPQDVSLVPRQKWIIYKNSSTSNPLPDTWVSPLKKPSGFRPRYAWVHEQKQRQQFLDYVSQFYNEVPSVLPGWEFEEIASQTVAHVPQTTQPNYAVPAVADTSEYFSSAPAQNPIVSAAFIPDFFSTSMNYPPTWDTAEVVNTRTTFLKLLSPNREKVWTATPRVLIRYRGKNVRTQPRSLTEYADEIATGGVRPGFEVISRESGTLGDLEAEFILAQYTQNEADPNNPYTANIVSVAAVDGTREYLLEYENAQEPFDQHLDLFLDIADSIHLYPMGDE